jgi:hypothetical protein
MAKPAFEDVLTLAHRGDGCGKEALIAYYLDGRDTSGASLHLRDALKFADEIAVAAARIRAALAEPEVLAPAGHPLAAPPPAMDDLLKAAKRALNVLKASGESVRPTNALGALDAAIAKAEGR